MIYPECRFCDFYDSDFDCICPSYEKFYVCGVESEYLIEEYFIEVDDD